MLHSVSWICLLFLSAAAAFPASKDDSAWSSSGASPRSGLSRPPVPALQNEASAIQQPAAAPQQAPTANQAPSSSGAPSLSYQPSFASSSRRPFRSPAARPVSSGFPGHGVRLSHPGVGAAGSSSVGAYRPISSSSAQPTGGASVGLNPAAHRFNIPSFAQPSLTSSVGVNLDPYSPIVSAGDSAAPSSLDRPVQAAPASSGLEFPVYYFVAPPSSSFHEDETPLSWPQHPAGLSSFSPSGWMPSRSFPVLGVWSSEDVSAKGVKQEAESEEVSLVPSSSYIVQSRNGYLRAREAVAHLSYVPEQGEPQVIYYEVVQRPEQPAAAPKAPVKGGKKP
ncbi:arf-GAP domain and FG repeat-containing protein 2-like isoform X3 [Cheilinus undulatus]|uniref:arf-GAP domain and FG repeat-containing protein 2-like isoform X3 n=1 Tax=Cheilinus undulatus TaxID=241271 RepID=UPI001BD6B2D1|nr:arf-GAP domain and FG repeat-containing protein 2-like isoform X3 [Cheilinus undulatus]